MSYDNDSETIVMQEIKIRELESEVQALIIERDYVTNLLQPLRSYLSQRWSML